MSERVHPGGDTPEHPAAAPGSPSKQQHPPPPEPEEKIKSPPGTYVIQVPKEQIFRVPTPETARRFKEYTRRGGRGRRSCCCCLWWTTGTLLVLSLALAAAAGVLYLVFRPRLPKYAVDGVSVKGFNLTSGNPVLSPEFDVAVRVENPNNKIGIRYRSGSSVAVSYSGVDLCSGGWPVFYQGPRNTTVVRTSLTGSGIRLSSAMDRELAGEQGRGEVPLVLTARVPVRIRVGAVTTWTITVKVRCDLVVDSLTASSKVVSTSCGVKVEI